MAAIKDLKSESPWDCRITEHFSNTLTLHSILFLFVSVVPFSFSTVLLTNEIGKKLRFHITRASYEENEQKYHKLTKPIEGLKY